MQRRWRLITNAGGGSTFPRVGQAGTSGADTIVGGPSISSATVHDVALQSMPNGVVDDSLRHRHPDRWLMSVAAAAR